MPQSIKILIVEDSPVDAELYSRILQNSYACRIAATGAEALALLQEQEFACTIVDYGLPGMDGLTLMVKIRELAQFMPLVMLTGLARDDIAAAVLRSGANSYIEKTGIDVAHLNEAVTAAIAACDAARAASATAPRPILIVEDDADDRETYIRLLKRTSLRSFGVVEAATGAAALAELRHANFAAILLDYGLPGMDGLAVLAAIRASHPFVPIIFITGNGSVNVAIKALRAGASDYLVKSALDAEQLDRALTESAMKCALAAKDAEIRATTEALCASEERNRLLLSSLSEDAIIMLDPDGTVASWNFAAQRINGYAAEEVIGKPYAMFFTPEDQAAGAPALALEIVRATGRHAVDGWRVRKNGSRLFASVVIDAIRDDQGALRGFAKVTRDITESAAEQAALRRASERITLAADFGGIGIWDYNVDTRGSVWDGWMFRLFGMPPSAGAPGQDIWRQGLHPDDRAAVEQALQDVISGRKPYDTEFRVVWQDGSEHVLRACGQLTRDFTDGSTHLIGVNWDVTEARRLSDALAKQAERVVEARDAAERANAAKSRFLAGMSHELRTPLNGILGNARLLRLEGGLSPGQAARVETMVDAGTHLLEMIHCVLDLSEIETEQVVLAPEAVDPGGLAQACLGVVRHIAQEKGLAVRLGVASDVPARITADPTRLRQILLNLLGNAAKFTRAGGIDVRLHSTADGSTLRIEVADTGPGIPPEQRHRLFQEFGRARTQSNRLLEGAGLGLALSAKLAALMGGRLGHAENPGGGSIFWLELPLVTAKEPQKLAALAAGGDPARQPLNVLIVDDSAMNLDIAQAFVRVLGHRPHCVDSGAAAVAAVAAGAFDVVLMDVQMPEMDGLDATRRIRALPDRRAQVPVVALTAEVFTEQLEACRRSGMTGHLAKPFTEMGLAGIFADVRQAGSAHTGTAQAGTACAAAAELPVIDTEVFRTNTRLLRPASVVSYLENIAAGSAALLATVRNWDGTGDIGAEVLKAAHKLAGNVGLFGFSRAADAARRFERAARLGGPDIAALAEAFSIALQLSIEEAARRLAVARAS